MCIFMHAYIGLLQSAWKLDNPAPFKFRVSEFRREHFELKRHMQDITDVDTVVP